jgi:ubiquinone/menaquinone biosynthesis C-methylase UbiE
MSEYASAVAHVQGLYRAGKEVRFSFEESRARAYFRDYVGFVSGQAPSGGRVLDIGCGSGWSSLLLSEAGFDVTGIDVTATAFEVQESDRLHLRQGDAMSIPFADASFDVVTGYQMLEHVPDPRSALGEFARVLRPGGTVCVVGPNLIAPLPHLYGIARDVWKNRPLSTIIFRRESMPRHPMGNTLPELIANLGTNTVRLVKKLASRDAEFTMRMPDTRPPFYGDNDACYLCNPVDLERYFVALGYRVTRKAKPGRPAVTSSLAGGTWFAAKKPT